MDKELMIVGDRVLIEPDEGEDRTDSGLYLPRRPAFCDPGDTAQ